MDTTNLIHILNDGAYFSLHTNALQKSTSDITIIIVGNGHSDQSSNPEWNTNTLGNSMNPIILPPAIGK